MYAVEAILSLSWTSEVEVRVSVFLPAYSIRRNVQVSFSSLWYKRTETLITFSNGFYKSGSISMVFDLENSQSSFNHRLGMHRRNVFGCICLCVCPVRCLDLETLFLVFSYIVRISRPSSCIKVILSRSRSQEQKMCLWSLLALNLNVLT